MRKIALILFLILSCTALSAQESDSYTRSGVVRLFNFADSLLYKFQHRENYDTSYMERAMNKWVLKTRTNYSNNSILALGTMGDEKFKTIVSAKGKFSQSFTVGYRSLYGTVSLSPSMFRKDRNDLELGLSSQGNSIGFELLYHKTDSYKGKTIIGENEFLIPTGEISVDNYEASGYYVLNHRRYSNNAAMNQGYIQKKSAGSLIATADLRGGRSYIGMLKEQGNPEIRMTYFCAAIGIGYGYNLVLSNGLMFHASAKGSLIVYDGGDFVNDGESRNVPMDFPDFMVNASFSTVYPFGKYFTGASVVFKDDSYGNGKKTLIENMRYRANIFVGVRF